MEIRCGLLGRKLGHSYSPLIHQWRAYPYTLFEKEPEEIGDFLKNGDFTGLNVTIPYKKTVLSFCSHLSPEARKLGAVNTLVREADGTLTGHNTDYHGFSRLLDKSGVSAAGKKCLVLGSGGASGTAAAVLRERGGQVVVISRTGKNNYQNLFRHRDAALLVNATPVGMYPQSGQSPVSLDDFPHLEAVLDMIYNPAKTRLLLDAEERGIPGFNGLWMLVEQARESALWFTGTPVSDREAREAAARVLRATRNIVLIGMPGCGKTTLAKKLSRLLGREVLDTDRQISQRAGMSIPEIFASRGEAYFRQLETQVLSEAGQESGKILATGGGCVTRPENVPLLRQNGLIFWVQRDLHRLSTAGRPLSQSRSPEALYRERKPLYRQLADFSVFNNGHPEAAAVEIQTLFETWTEEAFL